MTVPLNDTRRRFLQCKESLNNALLSVAASGRWLLGEETRIFSQRFAALCQTNFCLPVANGTDALELTLRALGCTNRQDEVITCANAGGYTSIACHLIGVTPVYVDISPTNLLIDIQAVREVLSPRTKVVVVTHLYGGVADVPALRCLLDAEGYSEVAILEDCAQAHGAQLNGCSVGSLGTIATFSFYPTKNLGCMGDGGAIVTSDATLYERVQQLHQYGWGAKYHNLLAGGRNSRIDELQAAVLNRLLEHLESWNIRRREILETYRSAGSCRLSFIDYTDNNYVAHLAIARTVHREAFRTFMNERGIATDIHYPILDCDQKGWQKQPQRSGDLRVSRRVVREVVSLPLFPELTDEEITIICAALRAWENE